MTDLYYHYYLCLNKSGSKFECTTFNTIKEADKYFSTISNPRFSTIIPINKNIPEFLHKIILKKKICDLFYVKITTPES